MNRDAFRLMAGMVGALGVSAVGSVCVARVLGPVGRGELALVSAICGFAIVLGALGLNVAFRTLYPKGESRVPVLVRAALVNGIVASVATMAAVTFVVSDPLGSGLGIVCAAGLLTVTSLGALLSLDVLKAQGKHGVSGMADLGGASSATAASLVLIFLDWLNVASALLCLALGFAVRTVAMCNRRTRKEYRLPAGKDEVVKLTAAGRSYFGFTLGQHVALQSDVLIAGLFLSREDLGLYGAAATLAMLARVPGIALGHVIGHKAALGDSTHQLRREIVAGSGVGLVVALAFGIFSGPLIWALYGSEFAGAADVLIILMVGQAALSAYPIVARVLAGMGKPRIIAVTGYTGGLFMVGAMAFAAPRFGAVGAAAAAATTYFLITCMMGLMYKRKGAQ